MRVGAAPEKVLDSEPEGQPVPEREASGEREMLEQGVLLKREAEAVGVWEEVPERLPLLLPLREGRPVEEATMVRVNASVLLLEALGETLPQALEDALRRIDADGERHSEGVGDTDVEREAVIEKEARADSEEEPDSVVLTLGVGEGDSEAGAEREPPGERLADGQTVALKEEDTQGSPEGVRSPLRDGSGNFDTVGQPVPLSEGRAVGVMEAEARGEALVEGEPMGEGEARTAVPVGATAVAVDKRVAEEQGDAERKACGEGDTDGEGETTRLPLAQLLPEGDAPLRCEGEGLPLAEPSRGVALEEPDTEELPLTERLPPLVALSLGIEDALPEPEPLAAWESMAETVGVR